jgi:hypothetical protein
VIFFVSIWLVPALGVLSCIYIAHCACRRPSELEVDDVIPFLRPVDVSLAESLLDPAAEFAFRWKLSRREFRKAQRRRMRLYLEVIRRMNHNAKLLAEYAEAEMNGCDPRRVGLVSTLQDRAIEVRLYVLMAGIELRTWLPLCCNILPKTPVLARLRKAGDIDGLQTYNALKAAAAALFVQLPADELDSLTRNL